MNYTTGHRMDYILTGRNVPKSLPYEKSVYETNLIEPRPSYSKMSDAERQKKVLHGGSLHGACVKKCNS
jgi:hypothetical protein